VIFEILFVGFTLRDRLIRWSGNQQVYLHLSTCFVCRYSQSAWLKCQIHKGHRKNLITMQWNSAMNSTLDIHDLFLIYSRFTAKDFYISRLTEYTPITIHGTVFFFYQITIHCVQRNWITITSLRANIHQAMKRMKSANQDTPSIIYFLF